VQAAYSCTPLVPAGVQMGYRERRHPSFFDKARENTEVSKSKIHLVDSAAVERIREPKYLRYAYGEGSDAEASSATLRAWSAPFDVHAGA